MDIFDIKEAVADGVDDNYHDALNEYYACGFVKGPVSTDVSVAKMRGMKDLLCEKIPNQYAKQYISCSLTDK